MKKWAKNAILNSGALRIASSVRPTSIAILMYHSVQPNPSLQADSLGGIVHSENVFREQMELLARDHHPISLAQAAKYIVEGGELAKRSVVVTFDDGYADNYEVAMPILNQAAIPATFYVTVDCVDNRRLPWPSRLRFAFRKTKLATWNDTTAKTSFLKNSLAKTSLAVTKTWTLTDAAENEEAYLSTCDVCCQLSGAAQDEFVRLIESELEASLPDHSGSLMMSYEQVHALIRSGHIVGSHTLTHPNMAYLNEEDALTEITGSKLRLESKLGQPIKHFSYPCPALSPHWSERTVAQCRDAGYETAVTTDSGLTRHGDDLLRLKRIRPTKTLEGLRWNLESAFAGRTV